MKKGAHPIIKGTLLLTVTGCITRLIGFYYKIFLSRQIGAEQLGIYQMTFPLFSLCIALSTSGAQLTISRLIGASHGDKARMRKVLRTGLILSVALAGLCSLLLCAFPRQIALYMLGEPGCAPALRILAYALPLSAVHICVSGYYFGQQKTLVPSVAELLEQLARVGGVWLLCQIAVSEGRPVTVSVAVSGLLIGEIASCLVCATCVTLESVPKRKKTLLPDRELFAVFFRQGGPVTGNRVILSALQSLEAVLIPGQLQQAGMTQSESYAMFGVLTGMAMPFILFPSTFVNSFTTMLLPKVAKAQDEKSHGLSGTVSSSLCAVLILGIFCTGMFLTYGNDLGRIFFHSDQAGYYITGLAWLCPLMYVSTTMASILHGMGRTATVFAINLTVMILRVGLVYVLLPVYGLSGYLWLLLGVQIVSALWYCIRVHREIPYGFDAVSAILIPCLAAFAAVKAGNMAGELTGPASELCRLCLGGSVSIMVFGVILWGYFEMRKKH